MSVAILLAIAGGYMDAYTYLTCDGVFANAQTGNIVLMGMNLAEGKLLRLISYLLPIAAFFLGVLLTEWIKSKFTHRQMIHWEQLVLLLEMLLLFLVGLVKAKLSNEVVTVVISLVCSVQVQSFRKVHNLPYASTMCTGNLRSAAENLFSGLAGKNPDGVARCGKYILVILFFILGAIIATKIIRLMDGRAIWICCVFLLGSLGLLHLDYRRAEEE